MIEYKYIPDICENLDFRRKPITEKDRVSGNIPYYGASGIVDYVEDYIFDEDLLLVSEDGANLLMRSSPIAFSISGKSWVNNHAHVLKFSDSMLQKFVELYLNSISLEPYITGSAQPKLNQNRLNEIPIPVPDKQVIQEAINSISKVEFIIFRRKQQLAKLDELVKARFVELFGDPVSNPKGWKIDKAGKHIDLLSGFPFDSSQYTQSGVNICGGLIIMPQSIDWNDCKHWCSIEGYEEYTLKENDIVMALDRPWISEGFKVAMIDAEHLPALLIQRTARIRAIDINQRYLMYCFLLGGFDKHCNVTGSLVPHISAKDIRSFSIMLPPLELQEQFAAFVEQTDKSKSAIQKSLDKLETLKGALMQKYFG